MLALCTLLAVSTAAEGAASAGEKVLKTRVWGSVTVTDGSLSLGKAELAIDVKLAPLLGEPVISCATAWILPKNARHNLPGGIALDADILREAAVHSVRVVVTAGAGTAMQADLECDPGAMAGPFVGSRRAFQRLTGKRLERARSFTTPGSPDWTKLFRRRTRFISRDDARALFQKLIDREVTLSAKQTTLGVSVVRATFDLSAIERALLEQKQKTLQKKQAREEKQLEARQKAAIGVENYRRAQREKADYWNVPVHNVTRSEAAAAERRKKAREALERKHEAAREALQQQLERVDEKRRAAERKRDKERRDAEKARVPSPTCDGVDAAVAACMQKRCPEPFWDRGFYLTKGKGTREQRKRLHEKVMRETARKNKKRRQKWERCKRSARPHCKQNGFSSTAACERAAAAALRKRGF